MTLRHLLDLKEAFQKLLLYAFDSPKKNYDVVKVVNITNNYLSFFDNERRKLISRCADMNPENGQYVIKEEMVNEFNTEINKLLDTNIRELDGCEDYKLTINMDDFDTCKIPAQKEHWLTGADMMLIAPLFKTRECD